jgi:hypothetical protein
MERMAKMRELQKRTDAEKKRIAEQVYRLLYIKSILCTLAYMTLYQNNITDVSH